MNSGSGGSVIEFLKRASISSNRSIVNLTKVSNGLYSCIVPNGGYWQIWNGYGHEYDYGEGSETTYYTIQSSEFSDGSSVDRSGLNHGYYYIKNSSKRPSEFSYYDTSNDRTYYTGTQGDFYFYPSLDNKFAGGTTLYVSTSGAKDSANCVCFVKIA